MRASSLSISSHSSKLSMSSSRDLSPHASPRRGLLATHSPPLSPTLSQLDDYIDEKPRSYRRAPCISVKATLSILLIISGSVLLLNSFIDDFRHSKVINYDLVNQSHLPTQPSAVVVDDDKGNKKWTIWIPPQSQFPLHPWEYAEICAQAEQIQLEIHGGSSLFGKKKKYYHKDEKFVDVSMAIKTGLLPHSDAVNQSAPTHVLENPLIPKKECQKSMTFVMETDDAGMGNSLLALWLTYGLAKKEGRAFFVDDTRWPYGKYSSFFQAPPDPGCRPPPANERVPCPRSAQHLVISAATFAFVYGPSFAGEFVDKSKSAKHEHHKINHLMEKGYKDLFHLANAGDAAYVKNRTRGEMYEAINKSNGMTIGVHVRRGDVHPWEKEFHGDYLPLTRYMNEVREILITTYEHDDEPANNKVSSKVTPSRTFRDMLNPFSNFGKPKSKIDITRSADPTIDINLAKRHTSGGFAASQVFIASDDPLVYGAPEMSRLVRAQDRIVLASKADLDHMNGGKVAGPVDTVHGWEGGFFAAEFLSLGIKEKRIPLPARERYVGYEVQSEAHRRYAAALQAAKASGIAHSHPVIPEPTEAAMKMRQIVGRAYLLDLAVLGQSDAIVCGISSAGCRVLGVMVGWDRIKLDEWRNVDGKFGWQGLVVK